MIIIKFGVKLMTIIHLWKCVSIELKIYLAELYNYSVKGSSNVNLIYKIDQTIL